MRLTSILRCIREDLLDLVFARHYGRTFRMLTRKADRVEFAARRAQAATDAFVRIDHARATRKAPSSFRPDLLFSECGALTWSDARLSTRKGTTWHLATRMIRTCQD